ncbi:MAG TPA: phosphoadenylyl-sulfate reductase [bacterium]|nr:phosphoadenylyl-sulfate reductase [bacterium]
MSQNTLLNHVINDQLADMPIEKRLEWIWSNYPKSVIASSFGLSTVAIMDMYYRRLGIRIPVIFLDTLYHFRKTLNLVEEMQEKYNLDLRVFRPPDAKTRKEFEAKYGSNLWEQDVNRFHELTKLRQIRKALEGYEAWITGIRRDQSTGRCAARIIRWDAKYNLVKINPLADWTLEQVFSYIESHQVPYNPLHDQGYLSIGDEPLTSPVGEKEHQRAGRWRGLAKSECGLHL